MTVKELKAHARILAALYAALQEDMAAHNHDIDAHNLCSVVIQNPGEEPESYFSYSNPSKLTQKVLDEYEFIIGHEPPDQPLIQRGGMQDLHTEVRLLNYIASQKKYVQNGTITFFSTRSVCLTCRKAILDVAKQLLGQVAFLAFEFKAELTDGVEDMIYMIRNEAKLPLDQHAGWDYTAADDDDEVSDNDDNSEMSDD